MSLYLLSYPDYFTIRYVILSRRFILIKSRAKDGYFSWRVKVEMLLRGEEGEYIRVNASLYGNANGVTSGKDWIAFTSKWSLCHSCSTLRAMWLITSGMHGLSFVGNRRAIERRGWTRVSATVHSHCAWHHVTAVLHTTLRSSGMWGTSVDRQHQHTSSDWYNMNHRRFFGKTGTHPQNYTASHPRKLIF